MKNKSLSLVPLLFIMMSCSLTAQVKPPVQQQTNFDQTAPYLKDLTLPSFSIVSAVDGKEITDKNIPSNYKYTCILIFSPDCSHCEHEAGELNKYAAKLNNVFFIWDSYRDMDQIKKFAVKFNLTDKANVVIGRDPAFTIPTFFRPKMTPFVALYKNKKFLKVWEQGVDPIELINLTQGN
jgi:hypothetical protein